MSSINVNGVTYYSEPQVSEKESELKGILDEIKWQSDRMVENAKSWYSDYKEQGLSFGSIEAEGYLRAALEMNTWLKDVLK